MKPRKPANHKRTPTMTECDQTPPPATVAVTLQVTAGGAGVTCDPTPPAPASADAKLTAEEVKGRNDYRVAEYKSLRDEILHHVKQLDQLINLAVAVFGAALAAVKFYPEACLFVPMVSILLQWHYIKTVRHIGLLTEYIKLHVDPVMLKSDRPDGSFRGGWEAYFRTWCNDPQRRSFWEQFATNAPQLIFVFVSVTSFGVPYFISYTTPDAVPSRFSYYALAIMFPLYTVLTVMTLFSGRNVLIEYSRDAAARAMRRTGSRVLLSLGMIIVAAGAVARLCHAFDGRTVATFVVYPELFKFHAGDLSDWWLGIGGGLVVAAIGRFVWEVTYPQRAGATTTPATAPAARGSLQHPA